MIRVGLIGYGYWGVNLARNLDETDGVKLVAIADVDKARLDVAHRRHCQARCTRVADSVLDDPEIDAVVIATPVSTHTTLVLYALENGKHVLVEKPLCDNYAEAVELAATAAINDRVLMVDHTFWHHPAVEEIENHLDDIGEILHIDSVRVNLGLFQPDVNVIWDLAPHDLSILERLVGPPTAVRCLGSDPLRRGQISNAYLHLDYATFTASVHVSWLAPVKTRRLTIVAAEKMLVYDDVEPTEKVKVYDCGAFRADPDVDTRVDYRKGAMHAPKVSMVEALGNVISAFAENIAAGESFALTAAGVRVVRVLECAERSLASGGDRVAL